MTGQRTDIEVIRDCLSILEDVDRQYRAGKLTEFDVQAIELAVQENLDAILRPYVHKLSKQPAASESSSESSAT